MSIQNTVLNRSPQNDGDAISLVTYVESLFMPWNVDALIDGFTDDCVVRFGTLPEFQGREALRSFFTARMSKQEGYKLRKHFRSLANNIVTNVWEGEWEDADTRVPMKGFGVEAWTMRDGKIAIWEAAFNSAPAGEQADISRMIG